ncbi:MAG: hypothetical protein ACK4NA_12750 [Alphaproteobacteria bacterium]
MSVDLEGEFAAAYAAFDALGERGMERAQALELAYDLIGVSRVVTDRTRARYKPAAELAEIGDSDGFGANALIVPALDRDGQALVDLVAVPTAPDYAPWGRRLGVGCALGLENGWAAIAADRPVLLVPLPLAWLRHPWDAVCVLDWNAAPVEELLRAAPSLVVREGEEAFARFVHDHLRRPLPRPRNPEILIAPPGPARIARWSLVPSVVRRVEFAFDRP